MPLNNFEFIEYPFFRPLSEPGATIVDFLGSAERYEPTMKAIYAGLGIPPALAGEKPPHFHCPKCWGEEFRVNANDDAYCVKCNPAPVMLVCIPEICGSS